MEVFSNFQIIPSIRRLTDLDTALERGAQVILLTDADITNLQVLTQKIHAAGKQVWINTELLGGFGKDQAGLKLLKNYYKVDGVMSTDSARLKTLRHMGLYTVQRFFMTDSRSFETSLKLLKNSGMDAAEILPACAAAGTYESLRRVTTIPLLAGGFITGSRTAEQLRRIGFSGLTTSSKKLWPSQQNT